MIAANRCFLSHQNIYDPQKILPERIGISLKDFLKDPSTESKHAIQYMMQLVKLCKYVHSKGHYFTDLYRMSERVRIRTSEEGSTILIPWTSVATPDDKAKDTKIAQRRDIIKLGGLFHLMLNRKSDFVYEKVKKGKPFDVRLSNMEEIDGKVWEDLLKRMFRQARPSIQFISEVESHKCWRTIRGCPIPVAESAGCSKKLSQRSDMNKTVNETRKAQQRNVIIIDKFVVDLSSKLGDAEVYKGYQKKSERTIAVKIMLLRSDAKPEIRTMDASHDNAVTYHSIGTFEYKKNCAVYIAMEWCESSLKDLIHDQKRAESQSFSPKFLKKESGLTEELRKIKLMQDVAKGLLFIHRKNAHGCLKPSNVLYKNGSLKLSDHGVFVKTADQLECLSNRGVKGWQPPSSSDSNPTFSKRSDVFTAGLIFYYIWTNGCHPYCNGVLKDEESMQEDIDKGDDQCKENLKDRFRPSAYSNNAVLLRDLLESMLRHKALKRPRIKDVLAHPAFWSVQRKWNFLGSIVRLQDGIGGIPKRYSRRTIDSDIVYSGSEYIKENQMLDEIEKRKAVYGSELFLDNWCSCLKVTTAEKNRYGMKDKALTRHVGLQNTLSTNVLVRFVRNRREHMLQDIKDEDFEKMTEEDLWYLYSSKFPYLFLYCYLVIKEFRQENEESDLLELTFREYFEPAS